MIIRGYKFKVDQQSVELIEQFANIQNIERHRDETVNINNGLLREVSEWRDKYDVLKRD